jgi:hypothetical protein
MLIMHLVCGDLLVVLTTKTIELFRLMRMGGAARDGRMAVDLRAQQSESLPNTSCFGSLQESSAFFAGGSVGHSVTHDSARLDGIRLHTHDWPVHPLAVEQVHSTFFADTSVFPTGSVAFDHALVMRDIWHEWHEVTEMFTEQTPDQSMRPTTGISAINS